MAIWPEFHMGQYREDEYREEAPIFSFSIPVMVDKVIFSQFSNDKVLWLERCMKITKILVFQSSPEYPGYPDRVVPGWYLFCWVLREVAI